MPEKKTIRRAQKAKRQGKAPSSQAGEFIREEIHHVREGKHGARSTRQAIAIGLSKARRSGVKLPPPKKGQASAQTRKSAAKAVRRATKRIRSTSSSPRRARATLGALKREGRSAASRSALSRHARVSARKRGPVDRKRAALRAVRTKGPRVRSQAARKAARTRTRK
jgi:hypothetical protein